MMQYCINHVEWCNDLTFWVISLSLNQYRLVCYGPTDGRTDGRTDRRTDKASYRDAWTHLKIFFMTNFHPWVQGCTSLDFPLGFLSPLKFLYTFFLVIFDLKSIVLPKINSIISYFNFFISFLISKLLNFPFTGVGVDVCEEIWYYIARSMILSF